MLVVGLTGGVGSGKSTVAGLLTRHGAVLIDADQLARELVAPKSPGLSAIEQRFGPRFVTDSGQLDRSALAKHVFADETALADLNAIIHPEVKRRSVELIDRYREDRSDGVVILMVPLLIESGSYPVDVTVVVDCPEELAVNRLMATRGWTHDDAMARIAAQATRPQRLAAADYVIDNSGDERQLAASVDEAWQWILTQVGDGS